jgi:hypothetical protein
MAKKNTAYVASVKSIAAHAKKQIASLQSKKKKASKENKPALQAAIEGLKIVHAGITAGCQEMPQPGCQEMPRPGTSPGCQEMPRPGTSAGCQEMPRPDTAPGCQEMPRPRK